MVKKYKAIFFRNIVLIDRFFKIKKSINLNVTEQRKIEKFGVGNLFPDSHPPEFSFFKKKMYRCSTWVR